MEIVKDRDNSLEILDWKGTPSYGKPPIWAYLTIRDFGGPLDYPSQAASIGLTLPELEQVIDTLKEIAGQDAT